MMNVGAEEGMVLPCRFINLLPFRISIKHHYCTSFHPVYCCGGSFNIVDFALIR